ncbi:membrane hypothetical protein [Paraburkholderia piptadeniae]|uniref:DedA family protein n=1 Tax=Paraburkholderia piptadeniae TaxID=1701573 RepID=A0A1N7SW12_9BURK|nr:membrane hypothetical protein [Paraburkholderia piptadeniae]
MLSHELVARYGTLAVFLNVLGSSLGLPLPVIPTLITVGAGIALVTHVASSTLLHFAAILGAAVIGGVLGDLIWFHGGKRYGERTLHTVCKLSMSRETCVRKTERFFGRWVVRVLVVARFVPGLSLVAVPLCGAMAVRLRSFVSHDCAGVALGIGWTGYRRDIRITVRRGFRAYRPPWLACVDRDRHGTGALRVVLLLPETHAGTGAREGADQRGRIARIAREQSAASRVRYPLRRTENARSVCHSRRRDCRRTKTATDH